MRRLVVALALIAGCGKSGDDGPSCAQVVDHMLEVTKQQLIGHEGMTLGSRDAMIQQCEQRKMSPEARRCLVAAKSLADLASCRAGKRRRVPQAKGSAGSAGSATTPEAR